MLDKPCSSISQTLMCRCAVHCTCHHTAETQTLSHTSMTGVALCKSICSVNLIKLPHRNVLEEEAKQSTQVFEPLSSSHSKRRTFLQTSGCWSFFLPWDWFSRQSTGPLGHLHRHQIYSDEEQCILKKEIFCATHAPQSLAALHVEHCEAPLQLSPLEYYITKTRGQPCDLWVMTLPIWTYILVKYTHFYDLSMTGRFGFKNYFTEVMMASTLMTWRQPQNITDL